PRLGRAPPPGDRGGHRRAAGRRPVADPSRAHAAARPAREDFAMNETDWLTEERPDVAPPAALTTAHARAALLAHAEDFEWVDARPSTLVVPAWLEPAAARPARPDDERHPERRGPRRRPRRRLRAP